MQRRGFLKSAALTAASASRVLGANDRVRLALIGCGGRGKTVARHMVRESKNVEYAVMCDVYDDQSSKASQEFAQFGAKAETAKDFRKVLERNDLDAVHIATPDHGHAIAAVMACQAGKNIYCEKPLGHNIVEGRAIADAAAKSKGIFLTGTQHRSSPHLMEVRKLVQDGKLADVHFVRVWNYANLMPDGLAERPDEPVPAGLDWDMYLGPAPWVPYNRARFLSSYRGFFDYAGGWITDFGTHRFDSIHQIMGVDKPLSVSASGGRFAVGGMSDQPDILQVTYEYPGFVLSYETINTNGFGAFARTVPGMKMHGARGELDRPNGMAFYGSNATVIADRLGYEILPEDEPRPGLLQSGAVEAPRLEKMHMDEPEPTPLHAAHFIRCLREGETPRTDALTGHRSSVVPHLGNVSYKAGRKLLWDAEMERVISDDGANRLLGRKPRAPWDFIPFDPDEASS